MGVKYRVLGLMTCYNRCIKTKKAIETLISGNPQIEFQFLTWDDGSTDGTWETLEKFQEVVAYRGDGSSFYSGGMRHIIEIAKQQPDQYDYVLLFNDDVSFLTNGIQKLCENGRNEILVGPTCNQQGQLSYGGVVRKAKFRPRTEKIKGGYCDTFNANCVLIPWKIFIDLDNIDDVYTHSMGDFDYGFQARKKGYKIFSVDEFVGICDNNSVSGSWRDKKLDRKTRMKLKESPKGLPFKEWFHYLDKNYSFLTAVVYSVSPYIKILLKI